MTDLDVGLGKYHRCGRQEYPALRNLGRKVFCWTVAHLATYTERMLIKLEAQVARCLFAWIEYICIIFQSIQPSWIKCSSTLFAWDIALGVGDLEKNKTSWHSCATQCLPEWCMCWGSGLDTWGADPTWSKEVWTEEEELFAPWQRTRTRTRTRASMVIMLARWVFLSQKPGNSAIPVGQTWV